MNLYRKFFFVILTFLLFISIKTSIYANEIPFEGKGTIDVPYLIKNAEEFCTFRDLVNEGEDFKGQYLKQTTNFNLKEIDNWTPIGVFSSGKYFAGVFDGAGYSISGLTILGEPDTEDGNVGLFGYLQGTVVNVGISSGNIYGNCIGSIASHGNGNIINCYSNASLFGNRAGGIVDNFIGGNIISCWFGGKIEGNQKGGICSYDCNSIKNSYSSINLYNDNFNGTIISETVDIENLSPVDAVPYLNRGLLMAESYTRLNLSAYSLSKKDNIKHLVGIEKQDLQFEGEGTIEKPYLVKTVDDLLKIKSMVEKGEHFSEVYFEQENNIDFSSIVNWEPIGNIESYFSFSGVYNGNGHIITNLSSINSENAALFQTFNGKIVNLGIENCIFEGEIAAPFTIELGECGTIYNCYAISEVSGNEISGLVVVNNGSIMSAIDESKLSGNEYAGIALSGNGKIEYSWSDSSSLIGKDYKGTSDYIYNLDKVKISKVNRYASIISLGWSNIQIKKWKLDDEFLRFSTQTISSSDSFWAKMYLNRFTLIEIILIVILIAGIFFAREYTLHIIEGKKINEKK